MRLGKLLYILETCAYYISRFDQPEVPKDWKPDPMRVLKVKINTQEDAEGTSKPIPRDANDVCILLF